MKKKVEFPIIGALLVRGINKPEYDVNQTPFQSPNKLVTPIFRQVSEELKPCLDQLGQLHNGVLNNFEIAMKNSLLRYFQGCSIMRLKLRIRIQEFADHFETQGDSL